MSPDSSGILLVDKPDSWTSFDVVAKIRHQLREATKNKKIKVGHAGTLDPFATGLLIVLYGKETKQQDMYMKKDKTYMVTAVLGKTSSTGDIEGEIVDVSNMVPEYEEIEKTVNHFLGKISQVPPKYSAIKIAGVRAYDLARMGKEVVLRPREVTIYSIENISYNYPYLTFKTHVSSGTYIRSLVQDIGRALNCGAYTKELRRETIGAYSVSNAHSIEETLSHLQQLV